MVRGPVSFQFGRIFTVLLEPGPAGEVLFLATLNGGSWENSLGNVKNITLDSFIVLEE